jgi:thioredoxin-dependent peroxiredoxin
VRELREFRAHHARFQDAGIPVAGVSRDAPEDQKRRIAQLELPYPLLSDPGGEGARALGLTTSVGLGAWSVELFRRTTILIDPHGNVAAVWGKVKIRGHAEHVLELARAARGID